MGNDEKTMEISGAVNRKRKREQIQSPSTVYLVVHDCHRLSAFDAVNGDYLGTLIDSGLISKSIRNQWMAGFDIDDEGAIYVAIHHGFIAKYRQNKGYNNEWNLRKHDKIFQQNVYAAMQREFNINCHDHSMILGSEGVVCHNDCLFVTAYAGLCGVLQFDLEGNFVAIIAKNKCGHPSSMNRINDTLFMLLDNQKSLKIVDIETKKLVKKCKLDIVSNEKLGDFEFFDISADTRLIALNFQHGIVQFCKYESSSNLISRRKIFSLDLNKELKNKSILHGNGAKRMKRNDIEHKDITEAYEINYNSENHCFYVTDHGNNRVIKFECDFNQNKRRVDVSCKDIEIFIVSNDDLKFTKHIYGRCVKK